ncbi:MAG: hypothetical protein QME05_01620 [Candidatus Margulisbacteria bacterium]|nr:hypothetical protein [Candidatus Margulisiibacteriota bacterium]
MKKRKKKDKIEHTSWFNKFSLLDRLKLSHAQQAAIKILRGLRIEGIRKPA